MKNEVRNIVKDIKAGRDIAGNIKRYSEILSASFTKYAVIKLSMNYFTMIEIAEGRDGQNKKETEDYFKAVSESLDKTLKNNKADEKDIVLLLKLRDDVTRKMKVLTSFTDAMSIFEYAVLRKDPSIANSELDKETIADNMYNYVFQDNDKLVINSKIQSLIAELPVRMTKERFFDIINNTLNIYKGGEKEAVNDFAEMLRTAALIEKPEGFEELYPELFEKYKKLSEVDYKNIDAGLYDELSADIEEVTEIIDEYVTDYLLIIEVINDSLVTLFTINSADKTLFDDKYETAVKILRSTIEADDIYEASAEFDSLFSNLEGAQEESYEVLANISSNLFDYKTEYGEAIEEAGLEEVYERLLKADKLTSTSYFMDLDKEIRIVSDAADEEFIDKIKADLEEGFRKRFDELSVSLRRSVMAKILSVIPVFFNNKEEIREYFVYALDRCSDEREVAASVNAINNIILGE